MDVEVKLKLNESLIESARRVGKAIHRDVEGVLTDTLELMSPVIEAMPEGEFYVPVASLTDFEVQALADSKMDETQNQRLGDLQSRGKAQGLSMAERYELLALLRIYQIGHLRKSEALAEAVRRGLRPPLTA